MTDNDFTAQVLDILDPAAYQSESTKWIAKHCKDYYTEIFYNPPCSSDEN